MSYFQGIYLIMWLIVFVLMIVRFIVLKEYNEDQVLSRIFEITVHLAGLVLFINLIIPNDGVGLKNRILLIVAINLAFLEMIGFSWYVFPQISRVVKGQFYSLYEIGSSILKSKNKCWEKELLDEKMRDLIRIANNSIILYEKSIEKCLTLNSLVLLSILMLVLFSTQLSI